MDLKPTDETIRVFDLALEEVVSRGHDAMRAEHILLGLLGVPEGSAAIALDAVDVDRASLRARVEERLPAGSPAAGPRGEYPYDATGAAVLEGSITEARRVGRGHVSTAHVLLGALAGEGAPAYEVLSDAGVRMPDLIRALRAEPGDEE